MTSREFVTTVSEVPAFVPSVDPAHRRPALQTQGATSTRGLAPGDAQAVKQE
jgi:hypothetical protein